MEADLDLLLQTFVVAVLVIASTVYAAWRLAPARTKLRALDALKPTTTNALGRWLTRLRKGVAEELAHGCSACAKAPDHVKKHVAAGRH
jgi:hypothetical protein